MNHNSAFEFSCRGGLRSLLKLSFHHTEMFMNRVAILLVLWPAVLQQVEAQSIKQEEVKLVLDRVLAYLNTATPVGIIDEKTGNPITDLAHPNPTATLVKSEYRIETHE